MHQRESQKKEDTSAPNVREVAKCCVFSMIRVSGQLKSRPCIDEDMRLIDSKMTPQIPQLQEIYETSSKL